MNNEEIVDINNITANNIFKKMREKFKIEALITLTKKSVLLDN